MRSLLLILAACGHDAPAGPPASGSVADHSHSQRALSSSPAPASPAGTAADHLQQALAAEGIHQRGDTPVDARSIDAFARSFVAVLASGDQRAALSLFSGELWDPSCSAETGRAAAQKLGGLLVMIPRNIHFSVVEPVGEPRTLAKGQLLGGCAVTSDTTVRVIHVKWTAPAGDATLEVGRAGEGDWTLTAIRDQ